jgi:hypothetical protein
VCTRCESDSKEWERIATVWSIILFLVLGIYLGVRLMTKHLRTSTPAQDDEEGFLSSSISVKVKLVVR